MWHQLRFIMSVEKYDSTIHESLSELTNQNSAISHNLVNSKMFKITLKYFSLFNNTPSAK